MQKRHLENTYNLKRQRHLLSVISRPWQDLNQIAVVLGNDITREKPIGLLSSYYESKQSTTEIPKTLPKTLSHTTMAAYSHANLFTHARTYEILGRYPVGVLKNRFW